MLRLHHVWRAGMAALIACVLAACAVSAFHRDTSIEGWLTFDTPSHAWVPVEPDRKIDLPTASLEPATKMLERDDALQLDPETFARLVPGHEWPSQTGRVPYLVRGVALDEPRGNLRVLENENDLLVQYEAPRLRARAIPRPVIVLMPAAPENLYVRISLFN